MFGNGFYNPYMYRPFYQAANMTRGLGGLANASNVIGANTGNSLGKVGLGELIKKFSFSDFLNGASKTLNVVNQAIPIFYQVKPIFNNAKTMFRIMGAVKEDDPKEKIKKDIIPANNTKNTNYNHTSKEEYSTENPVFFI